MEHRHAQAVQYNGAVRTTMHDGVIGITAAEALARRQAGRQAGRQARQGSPPQVHAKGSTVPEFMPC